ncbi:hypothetical protein LTR27_003654 [Elasticomyces elasticus]|nr:hypothetical protein LTR27_003654 [Elasticomyces elasticus]
MGTEARVALYAPTALAPWVSLPSTFGGTTSYYSGTTINGTSTWVQTAIAGYTPATVTMLTTYGDQPSSAVLVNPGVTPAASTNSAPYSLSATVTGKVGSGVTPSPSTSSSATPTNNSTAAPTHTDSSSHGLSTGAEVGIGVGVGGLVCLIAAVALVFFCWGRRKGKANDIRGAENPGTPFPGPTSPGAPQMMQQQPYYPQPGEAQWQSGPGHPMSQPLMHQHNPYFGQGQLMQYSDGQTMHGSPSPPMEKHALHAPYTPPMELSAEVPMHEVDASPLRNPPTPSPTYSDVNVTTPRLRK